MHISSQQEVLVLIFIFQKIVIFMTPLPSHILHHKQIEITFNITKFSLSDRMYPIHIECIHIRVEGILWPEQILRAVKVRAI